MLDYVYALLAGILGGMLVIGAILMFLFHAGNYRGPVTVPSTVPQHRHVTPTPRAPTPTPTPQPEPTPGIDEEGWIPGLVDPNTGRPELYKDTRIGDLL